MEFEACTLPTPERPLRVAEFDALFASVRSAERVAPTRLRLALDGGGAAALAADLAVRETACCAFFTFTLTVTGAGTDLEVTVPAGHVAVLDALAARAGAAR
ncbi:MAG: hypothetical protein ACJ73S_13940 [Mycobacteriales bacterium]